MVDQTTTRITAETYFQLPEYEQYDRIQLIDGQVVIGDGERTEEQRQVPPLPRHQDVVLEIGVFLRLYEREHGGKAYISPIEVLLNDDNVFEPDALYLKPESSCEIGPKRLVGAPDLVIEVLSLGTARRDRQEKFYAYARNGVTEYWIVDPVHDVLEVYVNENGKFVYQGAFGRAHNFDSVVLEQPAPIAVSSLIPAR